MISEKYFLYLINMNKYFKQMLNDHVSNPSYGMTQNHKSWQSPYIFVFYYVF